MKNQQKTELAVGQALIDGYLEKLIEYMKTNTLTMTNKQYIDTYQKIVQLADELDRAAELYLYYKQIIENYIKNNTVEIINKNVNPEDNLQFLKDYST